MPARAAGCRNWDPGCGSVGAVQRARSWVHIPKTLNRTAPCTHRARIVRQLPLSAHISLSDPSAQCPLSTVFILAPSTHRVTELPFLVVEGGTPPSHLQHAPCTPPNVQSGTKPTRRWCFQNGGCFFFFASQMTTFVGQSAMINGVFCLLSLLHCVNLKLCYMVVQQWLQSCSRFKGRVPVDDLIFAQGSGVLGELCNCNVMQYPPPPAPPFAPIFTPFCPLEAEIGDSLDN